MSSRLHRVCLFAALWCVTMHIANATAAEAQRQPLHTSEQFTFVANASMAEVFPLFGADRERVWAPGWNPRFVWPSTPGDRQGMVFEVPHRGKTATWVNTVFDPTAGQVQYVYVLPEVVSTVITLNLQPTNGGTRVVVQYERTSLSADADAVVKGMAEQDRAAGPEWGSQINAYLAGVNRRP